MSDINGNTQKTPVRGGVILRNSNTGQLVSVETENGVSKKSPKTINTVKEVSNRRHAALKRLANR